MEQIEEEQWIVCRLCKMVSRVDSRQWVQACQCPLPFHRHCLQYYVWICESKLPLKAPACYWCKAPFRVEPVKGVVIRTLETITRSWYPKVCYCVYLLACQVLQESATATIGFINLSTVYGFEEACALLMNMDPLVAVIVLHDIPLIAVTVNYIPWEEYFLRFLRSGNKLPVLGAVMPKGGPELQPLKQPSMSMYDFIMGGLILPSVANITGNILFSTEESTTKRFLLGGAFFLVMRGIAYMYYRQKKYIRQNTLTVANYIHTAIHTE